MYVAREGHLSYVRGKAGKANYLILRACVGGFVCHSPAPALQKETLRCQYIEQPCSYLLLTLCTKGILNSVLSDMEAPATRTTSVLFSQLIAIRRRIFSNHL